MKNRKMIILIGAALAIIAFAFMREHRCCLMSKHAQKSSDKVSDHCTRKARHAMVREPLCVRNATGAQISAALYSKEMHRKSDVVSVPVIGKTKIKRSKKASILAVARKPETLQETLNKSVPHVGVCKAKAATVKRAGYELVITTSASCKKH